MKGHRIWKLIDLAHMSSEGNPPDFFTARYAPPESILLNYPNLPSDVQGSRHDMWSYGVLAFESCTGAKLFDRPPRFYPGKFIGLGDVAGQEEDKAMLNQMIRLIGPPPASLQLPLVLKSDLSHPIPPLLSSSIFSKLPDPLLHHILPWVQRSREGSAWREEEVEESLRTRILKAQPNHMGDEDVSELAAFLLPLLAWDPCHRACASQASAHPFLKQK